MIARSSGCEVWDLESVDFLLNAFFKQLEGLPGKVRGRPVLFVPGC